jgi:Xaa-Pro aminopeptidase
MPKPPPQGVARWCSITSPSTTSECEDATLAALAIKDAFPMRDEIRQVKSTDEIAVLRKAAAITAQAFWAAATAIAPGRTQRQIEGEVLRACLQAGSNGPSLWPWIRSGPNSLRSALFAAFFDSTNLHRVMNAGDIVRVDLGCDSGMYKGDLDRTVRVTGHFDVGQAEAPDLLTGAYRSGVDPRKEGAVRRDITRAGITYVNKHRGGLKTAAGRANSDQRPVAPARTGSGYG